MCFFLQNGERNKMLVSFVLLLQGVIFYVLYNQMPTSLTFFAFHNVNNQLWGWSIPAAEYQVLNPVVIVLIAPILAWLYQRHPATHATKFCIGMTFSAIAFLVLAIPQHFSATGVVSPLWMVLTYFFQSTGELLISGLGLAMVAELCPEKMSGYVMGIWWLTNMLAGPLGAWVGGLTTALPTAALSPVNSLHLYGNVFGEIGVVVSVVALMMWMMRSVLNKALTSSL